jgi:hypothetical protein
VFGTTFSYDNDIAGSDAMNEVQVVVKRPSIKSGPFHPLVTSTILGSISHWISYRILFVVICITWTVVDSGFLQPPSWLAIFLIVVMLLIFVTELTRYDATIVWELVTSFQPAYLLANMIGYVIFKCWSFPNDTSWHIAAFRITGVGAQILLVLFDAAPAYPITVKRVFLIIWFVTGVLAILRESGVSFQSPRLIARDRCFFEFCFNTRSMYITTLSNIDVGLLANPKGHSRLLIHTTNNYDWHIGVVGEMCIRIDISSRNRIVLAT